jgi:hypothetical protein
LSVKQKKIGPVLRKSDAGNEKRYSNVRKKSEESSNRSDNGKRKSDSGRWKRKHGKEKSMGVIPYSMICIGNVRTVMCGLKDSF